MSKPIYIVVTPFFPTPTSWRGPFCYDFVKALERTGKYQVVVFKEGDGTDYEIGGVKVYTFKALRLPSNVFPNLFARYNQRSFIRKVESVLCSTFNLQPSTCYDSIAVVHGHTSKYAIYPLALKAVNPKCKTLLQHHDPQSYGLNSGILRHCWLYNLVMFPLLRRIYERIDCHVFISEVVKKSFLMAPDTSWTTYWKYCKQMRYLPYRPVKIKDSIILHNGVDKSIFHPSTSQTSSSSQTFTIGCVANFDDWKDQATLIKAVGLIDKPINVVFVGSGTQFDECKRLAREQEEQFRSTPTPVTYTFLSEVPHEQLADFYRSLDLFVLPSYFEGFGCVFTEAHSCGVPFITCEGQGMDDIIPPEDRGKWLCKQRDPVDLAEKIEKAINSIVRLDLDSTPSQSLQRLTEDQNIDNLVSRFVKTIE